MALYVFTFSMFTNIDRMLVRRRHMSDVNVPPLENIQPRTVEPIDTSSGSTGSPLNHSRISLRLFARKVCSCKGIAALASAAGVVLTSITVAYLTIARPEQAA